MSQDYLPISKFNTVVFCPRRYYIEHILSDTASNHYLAEGSALHDRAKRELEPDVYISKDGGRLKVSRRAGREVLLERPLAHVNEVVVLGNAVVTPAALYAYMEQSTGIHYLTKGGTYFAQVTPLENKNVPLRIQQVAAYLEPARKHDLARAFVLGKVQNAAVFARRGMTWGLGLVAYRFPQWRELNRILSDTDSD